MRDARVGTPALGVQYGYHPIITQRRMLSCAPPIPVPKRYTPNDAWSQKAAKEGYRARSVYKLIELDERFKLLKAGMTVLDLGAAPGSWLQYTAQKIGTKGKAIGIDLQEIDPIGPNAVLHKVDITDIPAVEQILVEENVEKADLILSDLAPSTSGVRDVDQWKSIELSEAVLSIAKKHLQPRGRCVVKVLRGADFDAFLKQVKADWQDVHLAHVKASRDRSTEIYMIVRNSKS